MHSLFSKTTHFAAVLIVCGLASLGMGLTGCSEKEPVVAAKQTIKPPRTSEAEDAAASEAVVGQFLDRIRRGGENHNAMSLLTRQAQAELSRINQQLQPIGSPDATFEITRSSKVSNGDSTSMVEGRLVHCLWKEPSSDGSLQSYQVVWSVQLDEGQWKISGLVLETVAGQPPLVLDFENGELMAQVLGGSAEPEIATAPDSENGKDLR